MHIIILNRLTKSLPSIQFANNLKHNIFKLFVNSLLPMDPCLSCNIEDKLAYCCHANPETGESVELVLDNGSITNACPNFDYLGNCLDYENRPDSCREYADCTRLRNIDIYEFMMINRQ